VEKMSEICGCTDGGGRGRWGHFGVLQRALGAKTHHLHGALKEAKVPDRELAGAAAGVGVDELGGVVRRGAYASMASAAEGTCSFWRAMTQSHM
jgi:hypothetical protein